MTICHHPRHGAACTGYREAQDMTPDKLALKDKLVDFYQRHLDMLKESGKLPEDVGKDNYAGPHYWDKDIGDEDTNEHLYSPADYTSKRTFETSAEGEQKGFTPVTKDPVAIAVKYGSDVAESIANSKLADTGQHGQLPDGRPLAYTGFAPKDIKLTKPQLEPSRLLEPWTDLLSLVMSIRVAMAHSIPRVGTTWRWITRHSVSLSGLGRVQMVPPCSNVGRPLCRPMSLRC